jgi:hypothetical protein
MLLYHLFFFFYGGDALGTFYFAIITCYIYSPVIAQFVARSKRLKDKGQTGKTGTFPTQCHLNGEVLSI